MMGKLMKMAETQLGVDLDGDGKVGKKPVGGAQGGGGAPGYPQQGGAYPQGAPGGSYPGGAGGGGPAGQAAPGGSPTGMRKALLIGINYIGSSGELRGCINDVQTMRGFLRSQGFQEGPQTLHILVDDPSWNTPMPTRQNVMQAFQWLVQGARPGDNLFFHYSGHGGQLKDQDGDEADGMDETLIPVDFQQAGQIRDDDVFATLVAPLPSGVKLTVVMDCCHSGTALDLPFSFKATEQVMSAVFQGGKFNPAALPQLLMNQKWDFKNKKNLQKQALQFGMQMAQGYMQGMKQGAGGGGGGGPAYGTDGGKQKQVLADVIMFSGCQDTQTSADVSNVGTFNLPPGTGPGGAGGACTSSLVSAVGRTPGLSFIQLLEDMRQILKQKGFKQVPQLSTSRQAPMNTAFSLVGGQERTLQPDQMGSHFGAGGAPPGGFGAPAVAPQGPGYGYPQQPAYPGAGAPGAPAYPADPYGAGAVPPNPYGGAPDPNAYPGAGGAPGYPPGGATPGYPQAAPGYPGAYPAPDPNQMPPTAYPVPTAMQQPGYPQAQGYPPYPPPGGAYPDPNAAMSPY